MTPENPSDQPEKWDSIGEQVFTGFVTAWVKSDASKAFVTMVSDLIGGLLGLGVTLMAPVGIGIAKGIAKSEDLVAPALSEMAAAAVSDMFGIEVDGSAFSGGIKNGNRRPVAEALGAGLIKQLTGDASELKPDGSPAAKYVTVMANMALEGWYQKWFFEFMSSLIPQLDVGKIENFGSLDDKVAEALGLGRLARRVLAPIVDTTIVTPLKWQTDKTYRPNLLTPPVVAKQVAAEFWAEEAAREELARQGWSEDRITALLREGTKDYTIDDLDLMIRAGLAARSAAQNTLGKSGWGNASAGVKLDLERLRRIESFEKSMATLAVDAYADGRVTMSTAQQFFRGTTIDAVTEARYRELSDAKRLLTRKHLSPSEARAAVKAKILAVSDYREALRQDNYDESAVLVLELLLRVELDAQTSAEEHRRQAEAERAAEKRQRDEAARQRKAQVDAERELHRRGALADMERAVIRGIVPMSRYTEIIAPQYDTDTVQILVTLLEDDRVAFVEQQKRAEDARKRAAVRNVDVGALEQAVLHGVLTLSDFRGRLGQLAFTGADADLLTATLQDRLADAKEATRKREEAEAAAKRRSIDLGRYERLVVRGARTINEYRALLGTLGFDDASIAGMVELLEIQIADAHAAELARAAAALTAATKGPTLEQMRRAVILKVRTEQDYQMYLLNNGFTADAVVVLMAELRADVADAEDARRRRLEAEAAKDNRVLPLATVARAARLGLILPGVYQHRLEADGYTPDDIEIDMVLLTFEIAETAAARAAAHAPPPIPDPKGLPLDQMARAVKAGLRTLDDYRARAFELGFSKDAVVTIVQLLQDELQTLEEARQRREQLASEPTRDVAVSELEAAVKGGLITLDVYAQQLVALGYAEDVAALYAAVLEQKLTAAANA